MYSWVLLLAVHTCKTNQTLFKVTTNCFDYELTRIKWFTETAPLFKIVLVENGRNWRSKNYWLGVLFPNRMGYHFVRACMSLKFRPSLILSILELLVSMSTLGFEKKHRVNQCNMQWFVRAHTLLRNHWIGTPWAGVVCRTIKGQGERKTRLTDPEMLTLGGSKKKQG